MSSDALTNNSLNNIKNRFVLEVRDRTEESAAKTADDSERLLKDASDNESLDSDGDVKSLATESNSKNDVDNPICVCCPKPARYKCPRCARQTCSLTCCVEHKTRFDCSGRRPLYPKLMSTSAKGKGKKGSRSLKQNFNDQNSDDINVLPLADMDEKTLMEDMNFLNKVNDCLDATHREAFGTIKDGFKVEGVHHLPQITKTAVDSNGNTIVLGVGPDPMHNSKSKKRKKKLANADTLLRGPQLIHQAKLKRVKLILMPDEMSEKMKHARENNSYYCKKSGKMFWKVEWNWCGNNPSNGIKSSTTVADNSEDKKDEDNDEESEEEDDGPQKETFHDHPVREDFTLKELVARFLGYKVEGEIPSGEPGEGEIDAVAAAAAENEVIEKDDIDQKSNKDIDDKDVDMNLEEKEKEKDDDEDDLDEPAAKKRKIVEESAAVEGETSPTADPSSSNSTAAAAAADSETAIDGEKDDLDSKPKTSKGNGKKEKPKPVYVPRPTLLPFPIAEDDEELKNFFANFSLENIRVFIHDKFPFGAQLTKEKLASNAVNVAGKNSNPQKRIALSGRFNHGSAATLVELDPDATLGEALVGREVAEFPRLFITTSDCIPLWPVFKGAKGIDILNGFKTHDIITAIKTLKYPPLDSDSGESDSDDSSDSDSDPDEDIDQAIEREHQKQLKKFERLKRNTARRMKKEQKEKLRKEGKIPPKPERIIEIGVEGKIEDIDLEKGMLWVDWSFPGVAALHRMHAEQRQAAMNKQWYGENAGNPNMVNPDVAMTINTGDNNNMSNSSSGSGEQPRNSTVSGGGEGGAQGSESVQGTNTTPAGENNLNGGKGTTSQTSAPKQPSEAEFPELVMVSPTAVKRKTIIGQKNNQKGGWNSLRGKNNLSSMFNNGKKGGGKSSKGKGKGNFGKNEGKGEFSGKNSAFNSFGSNKDGSGFKGKGKSKDGFINKGSEKGNNQSFNSFSSKGKGGFFNNNKDFNNNKGSSNFGTQNFGGSMNFSNNGKGGHNSHDGQNNFGTNVNVNSGKNSFQHNAASLSRLGFDNQQVSRPQQQQNQWNSSMQSNNNILGNSKGNNTSFNQLQHNNMQQNMNQQQNSNFNIMGNLNNSKGNNNFNSMNQQNMNMSNQNMQQNNMNQQNFMGQFDQNTVMAAMQGLLQVMGTKGQSQGNNHVNNMQQQNNSNPMMAMMSNMAQNVLGNNANGGNNTFNNQSFGNNAGKGNNWNFK